MTATDTDTRTVTLRMDRAYYTRLVANADVYRQALDAFMWMDADLPVGERERRRDEFHVAAQSAATWLAAVLDAAEVDA